MIEVKIIYVDPTGEVRMSPTGWPEEPTFKYSGGMSTAERSLLEEDNALEADYKALLQKAKEESIPFEDREAAEELILHPIRKQLAVEQHVSESHIDFYGLDKDQYKLDEFYTIEPIQVELVPKYVAIARGSKYKREGETELRDPDTYIDGKPYYIDGQLARIVTEEEKPQPAPAVDKPVMTAEDILFEYGIDLWDTDAWFYEQAVKAVEHALRQQPTEWIPELRKAFEAGKGCLDWDEYHGWKENYSFEDWLKSLPEPPKP